MPEYNFDGIVGPTHNYGGLSAGNVASMTHGDEVSNPREAALQGLEKMKFVAGLGVGQAVLPPSPGPPSGLCAPGVRRIPLERMRRDRHDITIGLERIYHQDRCTPHRG